VGSEFMLNGKRFPLEMHMVFFNKKYESFDEALDHFDGLCVLGFFFEISPIDNPAFNFIVADSLRKIIFTETTFDLTYHPRFDDLISDDTEHYYTLHGSLTTPPCLEVN
jgi:carbonic anhydrase